MKKKMIIGLIVIGIFLLVFSNCRIPKEDPILLEPKKQEEPVSKKEITLDIKGAITNPGVYKLSEGTVFDAIQKAGGLLETADTSYLNLSKKLQDEMVIIIYTKEEIEQFQKGNEWNLPIETCQCPKIENDGCLVKEKTVTNKKEEVKTEEKKGPHVIQIQTASIEEWMTLPGIGETKAQAIIEYRNTYGFESIEDVKKVKGIGESTYQKIQVYLRL